MATTNDTVIHWFRKGLRLHDNPALLAAVEKINNKHCELRPLFILDPWIIQKLRVGQNRWRFLQQALQDLDTSLRALGTRLYIVRGKPEEVFPHIFKQWNVKRLTFEGDIEPYAIERDHRIGDLALTANVEVIVKHSHTLYDPVALISRNDNKAPLTYQKFLSVVDKAGLPTKPCLSLSSLPAGCKSSNMETKTFDVPKLTEFGVEESSLGPCIFPGGETVALNRMDRLLVDTRYICTFEKPSTSPTSLEPSTTVLSPYLKFGCISPRTFYYKVAEVIKGNKHTKPPVSLLGQLMWREFYYLVGSVTPNYDQMEGNPICIQIPWQNNAEKLKAWTNARTGYPWIDAVMTQLRHEGWIHHLARHSVACFLTRGDLWVSWEEGQKVFEELLLDADWALNAGNWMWLSASAFFHQYFRVYSPVAFPKKTDKTGEYVRKYQPVLSKLPAKYIYEPWTAPTAVLKEAGVVLGDNYPHRIVLHEEEFRANVGRMAHAYKEHKANKDIVERKRPQVNMTTSETRAKVSKPEPKANKKITDFLKPK